jgi:hypothetical protein
MAYARPELEMIGEAFTANALLDWSGRVLAAAQDDLARLSGRGITRESLQRIEVARMDVDRLKAIRKSDRRADPTLAKERRSAIEEAIDWRLELRGMVQAVFDSQPEILERFRPGIKVSRSLPLIIGELESLLGAVREHDVALRPVGVTDTFNARGREILDRLKDSLRRLEEERSLTPPPTLDLNHAKGVLYTLTRYLCRIARVELRREPLKSARYGYALVRRGMGSYRR